MTARRQYDAAMRRNARIPEGFSLAPRPARQGDVMSCNCTPTQALDKVEQALIGRKMRVVAALSPYLRARLVDFADGLLDEELDEVEAELSKLIRDASRGICKDCGSYDACPCDAQADQLETGGY